MIPYILAAVGGYLIGDSLKGKQYARGGQMAIWGGVRGRLNKPMLSFSKVDYDVNVNPENLEVDVNIKERDSVDYRALSDTGAEWEQYAWGYMIYPKSVDELYQVLKALRTNVSKERLQKYIVENENYADGGMMADGGIPKEKSLLHFIQNEASSGSIANKTKYSSYKDIDAIRAKAVEILIRDGDKEYSLDSFNELIKDAVAESQPAEYGGMTEETANIYKMAEEMTDAEYEEKFSQLSEKQKSSVKSLIRLGDTPKLALATILLGKEQDENSETWNLHRYSDGGDIKAGVGDMVFIELNNGKIIEGKIEKLTPLKVRTSISDTMVIPNSLIKSINKKMSDGGNIESKGVKF